MSSKDFERGIKHLDGVPTDHGGAVVYYAEELSAHVKVDAFDVERLGAALGEAGYSAGYVYSGWCADTDCEIVAGTDEEDGR